MQSPAWGWGGSGGSGLLGTVSGPVTNQPRDSARSLPLLGLNILVCNMDRETPSTVGTCLGLWELLGGGGPLRHSVPAGSGNAAANQPILSLVFYLWSQGPEGIPGLPGFPVSTIVAIFPLCPGAVFILCLPPGMPFFSFSMTPSCLCNLPRLTLTWSDPFLLFFFF